jgi:hypothetical protein
LKFAHKLWRWSSGLVLGLAVTTYILALVVHNLENLTPRESARELKDQSDKLLSAVGATQQWNMFAPNVGTISYSPVVVIVMKNESRVALHSIVEPDMPNWEEPFLLPNETEGDARLYEWRFHIGDGRLRKYESRAASPEFIHRRIRTTYTRWRAEGWIAENPGRRKDVRRIELWRVKIRHPGDGLPLCCESTEVMPIYPWFEGDDWPVPIDPTYPFYRM